MFQHDSVQCQNVLQRLVFGWVHLLRRLFFLNISLEPISDHVTRGEEVSQDIFFINTFRLSNEFVVVHLLIDVLYT